jgi:hypothetical protein
VIRERLAHFEEMIGGFDFAEVIRRYWAGHESGDDDLKSAALRWLRGEFSTKTDARKALGFVQSWMTRAFMTIEADVGLRMRCWL